MHVQAATAEGGQVGLFSTRAAVFSLLLFVLAVLHPAASASAQETGDTCPEPPSQGPDICRVKDILDGQRLLFPDDDLVVGWQSAEANGGPWGSIQTIMSKTQDWSKSPDSWTDTLGPSDIDVGGIWSPFGVAAGRVFDLPHDVTVTMDTYQYVLGSLENTYSFQNPWVSSTWAGGSAPMVAAYSNTTTLVPLNKAMMEVIDVTGDGYDEVVLVRRDAKLVVGTAVDVSDPSKGLKWGTPFSGHTWANELSALAAGDFDGDGDREIAIAVGGKQDPYVTIFSVVTDPSASNYLSIQQEGEVGVGSFYATNGLSLTAGNFDGTSPDPGKYLTEELVLAIADPNIDDLSTEFAIVLLQAADNLKPTVTDHQAVDLANLVSRHQMGGTSTLLDSGRFDWFGLQDTAVLAVQVLGSDQFPFDGARPYPFLVTITADSDLLLHTTAPKALQSDEHDDCYAGLRGIAVSNFGLPADASTSPTLYIATLRDWTITQKIDDDYCGTDDDRQVYVELYDAKGDQLIAESLGLGAEPGGSNQILLLAAGDLQGRSMRLGAPTRIKISGHIQPDIVLGVPPMHVDYIPAEDGEDPSLVNVSVAPQVTDNNENPSTFASTYNFDTSAGGSSTHESTTSFTFSAKESSESKVSYGVPDVDGVSVTFKVTAEQTYETNTSKKYHYTSNNEQKISFTTGVSDRVWYTKKDFYIYNYPVIGQMVCPNKKPDCSTSEKMPLYLHFSAPAETQVFIGDADSVTMEANGLEWYQPVHEPGNLLTYPWSFDVLEQQTPGLDLLTEASPDMVTPADVATTFSSTWKNSADTTQSVGAKNKEALDTSLSIAGNVFDEVSESASLDIKTSTAFGTLNTTTSSVSESQGVLVNVPDLGDSHWHVGDFQYQFAGYIFGEQVPVGTFQDLKTNNDLETSGVQRLRFVSQPTADLWELVYAQPDVSLNHPDRWSYDANSETVSLNPSQPTSIPTSEFHAMRGFFVTKGDDPSIPPSGPQVTVAQAGDVLTLQTRVYNYSMRDMPAGLTIKVRFYGQVFDATAAACQNSPQPPNCQFVGPSWLIDEASVPPLPGYPTPSEVDTQTALNWQLVGATWGTEPSSTLWTWGCGAEDSKTSCAGKSVLFWVLVWIEDASGNLVAEMPGHGLSEVPASTLRDITKVPLEQVSLNGQTVSFSNNIGVYNQPVYVCSAEDDCSPGTLDLLGVSEGDLWVDSVDVRRVKGTRRSRSGVVNVGAIIANHERSLGSVSVFFYEGDPADGGEPFDHEYIPYLPPASRYLSQVAYRPKGCGARDLYVLVATAGLEPVIGGTRLHGPPCGHRPPRRVTGKSRRF